MKKVSSILAVAIVAVAMVTYFLGNTAIGIEFMNDAILACSDCMIDFSEAIACSDCMIDLTNALACSDCMIDFSEALACSDCMIDGISAVTQLS